MTPRRGPGYQEIGKLINLGLLVIRGRETSDVARVIAVLDETSTARV